MRKVKGIEFHYPQVQSFEGKGVPFYKPHGSINFYAKFDHQFSYGNEPPSTAGKPSSFLENEAGEFCPQLPITAIVNGSVDRVSMDRLVTIAHRLGVGIGLKLTTTCSI